MIFLLQYMYILPNDIYWYLMNCVIYIYHHC